MDIRDLDNKAKLLEEINSELEQEYAVEKKLQLLERYKDEFSGFIEDFISFYHSNVNDINSYVDTITIEKEKKIEELQSTISALTKKVMEEKHSHEIQMEHLSYIAYHEPEKAIAFLSNLHIESSKNKKYIS
ncbi:MAG: hypothetical protein WBL93_04755 [Lutisporaceae bacterium]